MERFIHSKNTPSPLAPQRSLGICPLLKRGQRGCEIHNFPSNTQPNTVVPMLSKVIWSSRIVTLWFSYVFKVSYTLLLPLIIMDNKSVITFLQTLQGMNFCIKLTKCYINFMFLTRWRGFKCNKKNNGSFIHTVHKKLQGFKVSFIHDLKPTLTSRAQMALCVLIL